MADPAAYEVDYSFAGFQASNPTTPLPATAVDNEFANIETAVQELLDAVKDVRRSDGALKNGIVTADAMSAGVIAALGDLDEEAAGAIDTAIALVQSDLEADLAAGLATKAALVHTHAATEVSVSAITGIVGATVQAVLAELRALGPQTGDLRLSMDDTVRLGEVACNDGTIGDATSLATLASATTEALYLLLWAKVSDTYAPVTTGRGLTAAADFAAHKPMALTKMLGRVLGVAGAGSGLTSRANGQTVGAETVTLDVTQLPVVTPTTSSVTPTSVVTPSGFSIATGSGSTQNNVQTSTASATPAVTMNSFGGGQSHANVQPTSFLHAFLKL